MDNSLVTLREVLSGATPLLLVFLGYLLGLRAYQKQKEHELVRRRYLDEGLDAFGADVEHALIVFRHNWQHSLEIIKCFRDQGARIPKEQMLSNLLELNSSEFRMRPNYRVGHLAGNQSLWEVQQLLFAFVGSANAFFRDDLFAKILSLIDDASLNENLPAFVEMARAECVARSQECTRYYFLLKSVQDLTDEFEGIRFSLASVNKFSKRKRVIKITDELKEKFADKLEKYDANSELPTPAQKTKSARESVS